MNTDDEHRIMNILVSTKIMLLEVNAHICVIEEAIKLLSFGAKEGKKIKYPKSMLFGNNKMTKKELMELRAALSCIREFYYKTKGLFI